MRVRWTRLSIEDLDQAYEYISANNVRAARSTIDKIKSAVKALRGHPEIGREGRVEATRELVVPDTPFIVAYRIVRKRVEILAVIHGARRWPDSF